jgi:hypothetical protein
MNKKILMIVGMVVLLMLIIGAGIFVVFCPKPQVKSQAETTQDQMFQIDAEYGQKIVEVVGKQKENNCIAEKDVEVTVTLTGEKKIEKQWQTVSVEGVCKDLQKQKDDLARERSYKIGQLQVQLDVLTARPEAEREKALEAIRTFMGQPELELVYISTRHPSNFSVGRVTNQDNGGFTMEDVSGWQRKVEIYQQTEFINDRCEVYEYEVDPRNNQIVEIHVRYPEGIPASPDDKMAQCGSYGSLEIPLKTKAQIEQIAFAYLGRDPKGTGSMLASSAIQPQYIPSMKGAVNPAMNEWRWEDKSYKLPEGLYSDAFAYPVLRIIISSGGKLVYYFNSTGLFQLQEQISENNSTWEKIKQAINNCEVDSTFQSHSLDVSAKLKNGTRLNAIEPKIDDIINIAIEAESKCGRVRMATE